jgi:hypothetical protein
LTIIRPKDPIKFIADYLYKHNDEMKAQEGGAEKKKK